MKLKNICLGLANRGYQRSFPLYQIAYSTWKSMTDVEERQLFRRFIRPGNTVVDVGANIGCYTLFLSRLVGASGSVLAFEPESQNFARLQHAVRGRCNVSAIPAAVGEVSGPGHLYVSDSLNVDHRSYECGEERRRVPVEVVTLDDCLDGRCVSAMKIDVQGFELSVLRGAARTLSRSRRMLMVVEVWPRGLRAAGASADELVYSLAQCGFRLQALPRGGRASVEEMLVVSEECDSYFNLAATKD